MRWLQLLTVCVSLAAVGLLLGLWLAAQMGAGEGQGLAGGAIVLFWGLVGALLGLATGVGLFRSLTVGSRRVLLLLVAPAGILIVGLVVAGLLRSRADMRAHLEEAYERLPPFRIALSPGPEYRGGKTAAFTAEWPKRSVSFQAGERQCTGELTAPDAVKVLTALRNAEGVLYREDAPCGNGEGEGVAGTRLSFVITEARPPMTEADLRLNDSCLREYPALGEPSAALEKLLASGNMSRSIVCH